MSKLTVGSIEGLASEGYVISVPAGSKIVQAGAVLQVVSTTKTDSFSGSLATNSELAITGMSVSITPSATSSQVLVVAMLNAGTFGNYVLKRGSTNICVGDAAGSRDRVTASRASGDPVSVPFMFLDSPATTSATSYSISFVSANSNTVTVYVNRSSTDTDNGDFARYASTITVMEIAG